MCSVRVKADQMNVYHHPVLEERSIKSVQGMHRGHNLQSLQPGWSMVFRDAFSLFLSNHDLQTLLSSGSCRRRCFSNPSQRPGVAFADYLTIRTSAAFWL